MRGFCPGRETFTGLFPAERAGYQGGFFSACALLLGIRAWASLFRESFACLLSRSVPVSSSRSRGLQMRRVTAVVRGAAQVQHALLMLPWPCGAGVCCTSGKAAVQALLFSCSLRLCIWLPILSYFRSVPAFLPARLDRFQTCLVHKRVLGSSVTASAFAFARHSITAAARNPLSSGGSLPRMECSGGWRVVADSPSAGASAATPVHAVLFVTGF